MVDDLRPCPICGCDIVQLMRDRDGYWVWCSNCQTDWPREPTAEAAIRQWGGLMSEKSPSRH